MGTHYRPRTVLRIMCWACKRVFNATRQTAFLCSPRCRQFASRCRREGISFRFKLAQVEADDPLPARGLPPEQPEGDADEG